MRVENAINEKLELSLFDESYEIGNCSFVLRELLKDQPKEAKLAWSLKNKSGEASPRVEPAAELKLMLTLLDWDILSLPPRLFCSSATSSGFFDGFIFFFFFVGVYRMMFL